MNIQDEARCNELIAEVAKVVVGQETMISRLIVGLLTGGHVLLEGVPGLAKTLTVRTLAGVMGGSFETPAEIRMLASMGADLVGMSTVLEAIAARHLGASVFGVSLVTNLAAGLQPELDHLEVLEAAERGADRLVGMLRAVATAA